MPAPGAKRQWAGKRVKPSTPIGDQRSMDMADQYIARYLIIDRAGSPQHGRVIVVPLSEQEVRDEVTRMVRWLRAEPFTEREGTGRFR